MIDAGARITEVRPEFKAGAVVKRAFSIWTNGFFAFSLVAVVAYLPVVLFWLSPGVGVPLSPILESPSRIQVVNLLLSTLVSFIASGAVTYGVVEQLRGNRVDVGAMFGVVFRRGPALFAVAAVGFLAVTAGLVLLLVPGIYLKLALWLAVPVAVVERKGIVDSLRRSRSLTRDNLGTIFSILFLLNLFASAASKVVELSIPSLRTASVWVAFGLSHLATAVLMGLPAVTCAVAYHDLRALKEGTDTSELAKVFE